MNGVVHSVNVRGDGGVPKFPVKAAKINLDGVQGDFNKFRTERKAGASGRAVTLFSLERIEGLQKEGHPIEVGSTGENLTIEGIDWPSLQVGMRVRVGEATVELSEPCAPCSKIGESFVEGRFARIDHELQRGWSRWLACVVEEGMVSTGDDVFVLLPDGS